MLATLSQDVFHTSPPVHLGVEEVWKVRIPFPHHHPLRGVGCGVEWSGDKVRCGNSGLMCHLHELARHALVVQFLDNHEIAGTGPDFDKPLNLGPVGIIGEA